MSAFCIMHDCLLSVFLNLIRSLWVSGLRLPSHKPLAAIKNWYLTKCSWYSCWRFNLESWWDNESSTCTSTWKYNSWSRARIATAEGPMGLPQPLEEAGSERQRHLSDERERRWLEKITCVIKLVAYVSFALRLSLASKGQSLEPSTTPARMQVLGPDSAGSTVGRWVDWRRSLSREELQVPPRPWDRF